MVDVTTSPSGTSITYPPYPGYGGMNNGNNATLQAENFLAHLITNDDRHQGEHHILNRLSQIQADIPTMEGAVQSAISTSQNAQQSQASTYALGNANSQAQYALSSQNQASQLGIQAAQNFGNTQNDIATARENINLQVRGVQDSVFSSSLLNTQNFGNLAMQTAQQTGVITNAISTDGEKTRAVLTSQYEQTLNRQLLAAQNELAELRGDRNSLGRHHETEVKVSQQVNQAQAQAQSQAVFGDILRRLEGLTMVAHATNNNVVAGNSGATQTGAQTANPVNVRT